MGARLTEHSLFGADVQEDSLRALSPELLQTLLRDHSERGHQRNIFWATDDYAELGEGYRYHDPIEPERITGARGHIIMPRVLKPRGAQQERRRSMAEVFTPARICNQQNNLLDEQWFGRAEVFNRERGDGGWESNPEPIRFPAGRSWRDYVRDIRLEITCGEAPYLVSRYDAATGESIPLAQRIGLLDRKLRVVSENAPADEWLRWVQVAYQSLYGYEWQGDSLLIARENLLASFDDYYRARFGRAPQLKSLRFIAYIISWNLWQMDGLRGVSPGTCGERTEALLPGMDEHLIPCEGCRSGDIRRHNGRYCLIRDWRARRILRYIDLLTP
ncbi:MAG: restriction endonuclease subunit M [Akkermansia sp.]